MKKTLSLVLAFSMLLTLLLPMGALAQEENPNQELYEKLRGKFGSFSTSSDTAILAAKKLDGNSFYVNAYNNAKTVLLKEDYIVLRNYLKNDLGLTSSEVEGLINEVQDWIGQNDYSDLKLLLEDISAGKTASEASGSVEYIGSLRNTIQTKHGKLIDNCLNTTASKTDFAIALYNAVTNSLTVREKEDKSLAFEINTANLKNEIGTINTYLKKQVTDEMNYTNAVVEVAKLVETDFNEITKGSTIVEKLFKDLGITYVSYVAPNPPAPTPGGGGGTGGAPTPSAPATSTPSEVVVPEDPKAPVSATIGKEGTTVTTKDGVANVSVDEGKALATVEALAKKADGREVVLVVKPEGVKGMNANVSLPGSVVLALKDKKVNLEIVAGGVEYSIPHDAIDLSNIEKGSKVEFKSQEIKEEAPVELANGLGEVKNTIEFFLEITKGDKTTKVTKFNKTIEVKVNVAGFKNHDKLAAYYLDEEDNTLEFVGGYIKNNRIVLKLNHFSKYVLIESTKTFPDIAKHWSKDYVESMIAKNIVDGYSDGTFKPEGKITRAEFVKMVVCALNEDLVEYNGGFKDVKANDWHADYIATAKALGLIDGYADGSFRPNATIKRAEMAAILGKVVDVEIDEKDIDKASSLFTDFADIEEWAKESVAKVSKAGLMNGADGKFNANKDTTRAEAATTLYRLYIR